MKLWEIWIKIKKKKLWYVNTGCLALLKAAGTTFFGGVIRQRLKNFILQNLQILKIDLISHISSLTHSLKLFKAQQRPFGVHVL